MLIVLAIGLPSAAVQAQAACGDTVETVLIAGQHTPVGTVAVENDGQFLYVTYQTDGDWLIAETHLDVATRPEDLQQTPKGNPVAGKFAYKSEHDPAVSTVSHTIDLAAWPSGTQLYLAAHSVVVSAFGSETAWGEGMAFPGNNWAMYFPYQVQSCDPPPSEPGAIDLIPSVIEANEYGVSVFLRLIRVNGSDGQVTVSLDTQDISATLGEDYMLATNLVTFDDGETEKFVEIFILDDTDTEGDEQFRVYISDVTGAEMGESTSATCVIIDDDQTSGGA
jgi:hypothetical protein